MVFQKSISRIVTTFWEECRQSLYGFGKSQSAWNLYAPFVKNQDNIKQGKTRTNKIQVLFLGVFIISQILGYFQNSNISADLRGRVPKTNLSLTDICVYF